ncbi:hypothetical protein K2173_010278 [Erythroxylum novogranatense]|uniref:Phytocyanin domain-containing protein n=1 Tax=Erythroxylum novogranatense TaxID=1862640 RepID=A0AAV8TF10_9ROSI|nr:hypothetical protein K2173_010278 [Erythroxylum novogranatense]
MGSQKLLGYWILMFGGLLFGLAHAYTFRVGGRDGWVLHPREDYNHWAQRNRFQVNDTLLFKYKKGSDSVLVVNKDDYYSCKMKNPLKSLKDGDSIFKFNHPGPFFFISGNEDNCKKGQMVIIVVMAVRHKTSPAAPLAPSPLVAPPPPPPRTTRSPPALPPSQNPQVKVPPSPAPAKSGSSKFVQTAWLLLSVSVGVSSVLMNCLAGMV